MAVSLEFEGRNVEKAVQKACEELNISQDRLNYDVLSYGSTGIFGLAGTKKARIRVNLADEATRFESKTSLAESKFQNSNRSDSSASESSDFDTSDRYRQNRDTIAKSLLPRRFLRREA